MRSPSGAIRVWLSPTRCSPTATRRALRRPPPRRPDSMPAREVESLSLAPNGSSPALPGLCERLARFSRREEQNGERPRQEETPAAGQEALAELQRSAGGSTQKRRRRMERRDDRSDGDTRSDRQDPEPWEHPRVSGHPDAELT